jgi:hypothetical protein
MTRADLMADGYIFLQFPPRWVLPLSTKRPPNRAAVSMDGAASTSDEMLRMAVFRTV